MALGNDPSAMAADANGVWVANHDGTVWRLDAHTGRVISRSPAYGVPADLALLPANVAAFGRNSPGVAVVVNGPSDPGVVEINAAMGATTVFRIADRGPRSGGEAGAPRVAAGPSGTQPFVRRRVRSAQTAARAGSAFGHVRKELAPLELGKCPVK